MSLHGEGNFSLNDLGCDTKTSLWLTQFSDIHFNVDTRGNKMTLSTSFVFWARGDYWLVTRSPIGFVVQLFKQSSIYVGDTSQCIHEMYVVSVFMISMLTSNNNNMRTRHVQFLEFATVTPPFIQPAMKSPMGQTSMGFIVS